MNHYAAIDVSLELSSVCIVDATGKVVKETKVETHPEALVKFFKGFGLALTRIGIEAGPGTYFPSRLLWLPSASHTTWHTGRVPRRFDRVELHRAM